MAFNPSEIFELHLRVVEGRGLKRVIMLVRKFEDIEKCSALRQRWNRAALDQR